MDHRGICLKVNVIARMGFELSYEGVAATTPRSLSPDSFEVTHQFSQITFYAIVLVITLKKDL